MNALRTILAIGLLTALVVACGDAPDGEANEPMSEPVPAWVDTVAAMADAIQARPDAADSILTVHGMTRARLDSLLYEVAESPALTDAYQDARGR